MKIRPDSETYIFKDNILFASSLDMVCNKLFPHVYRHIMVVSHRTSIIL